MSCNFGVVLSLDKPNLLALKYCAGEAACSIRAGINAHPIGLYIRVTIYGVAMDDVFSVIYFRTQEGLPDPIEIHWILICKLDIRPDASMNE